MFPIAGQTAGPNWLTFFEETHGTLEVTQAIQIYFEISRATPST